MRSFFLLQCVAAYAAAVGLSGVAACGAGNGPMPVVSVQWRSVELGAAVERVAGATGVDVWIDRRVDPHAAVEASVTHVPVDALLRSAVDPLGLSAVNLGGFVYVGPPEAAAALPAVIGRLRRQARRLGPDAERRWLAKRNWSVPKRSQPRAVLGEAVAATGLRLTGVELVPFDVWPERALRDVPLTEFAAVLLAGFDLTLELDRSGARVTGLEAAPSRTLQMPDPEPRGAGARRRGRSSGEQVYSLRLKNQPLGPVVEQIAKRMGLTVEWDDSVAGSGVGRGTLVSCDVAGADASGLLDAVLQPIGLSHRLEGNRLWIGVAE